MKKRILVPMILVLLLALLALLFYLKEKPKQQEAEQPAQIEEPARTETEALRVPQFSNPSDPVVPEWVGQEREPYESPKDFAALQAQNPDIYAWLSIPGTDVEFPVVQRSDDTYYLTHDVDGNDSDAGAIFTESAYNTKTFQEPITVIYGHRMYDGAMFGCLQPTYYDLEQLQTYQEMILYLPDTELHYELFAAIPYDSRHIMYHYGDSTARRIQAFLRSIQDVHSLDAVVDDQAMATGEENLVVLSTCLYGDRNQRYLVIGKLTEVL